MSTHLSDPILPPGADTDWLLAAGGLLYALKDDVNHCAISVEMVDGAHHSPRALELAHHLRQIMNAERAVPALRPQGADGDWLLSGGLIYALRTGVNHAAIRVTMADGEHNGPNCAALASALHERLCTAPDLAAARQRTPRP